MGQVGESEKEKGWESLGTAAVFQGLSAFPLLKPQGAIF
jgi:hypothetical protein